MEKENKKSTKKIIKKSENKQEEKLSAFQVSNRGKFHKYYKDFINKKYKGASYTKEAWKEILKKDGLECNL